MNQYQKEANQLLRELERDLNNLLPEGTRCMQLLYQELDGLQWKGRFQGYRQGKVGVFQFVVDMQKEAITVGEEIQEII